MPPMLRLHGNGAGVGRRQVWRRGVWKEGDGSAWPARSPPLLHPLSPQHVGLEGELEGSNQLQGRGRHERDGQLQGALGGQRVHCAAQQGVAAGRAAVKFNCTYRPCEADEGERQAGGAIPLCRCVSPPERPVRALSKMSTCRVFAIFCRAWEGWGRAGGVGDRGRNVKAVEVGYTGVTARAACACSMHAPPLPPVC